jgi:hypothetical protein
MKSTDERKQKIIEILEALTQEMEGGSCWFPNHFGIPKENYEAVVERILEAL